MSTTGESTGTYRIEALKGSENYTTWRVQMSDILTDMGLWEYVTGETPMPADKALAADWSKKDRKALTCIRLRVSNSMMAHVISASTSKEAFDALSNVFNNEGAVSLIVLRRKFLRYTIPEGADLEEEIRKIKGLWQEINLIQKPKITDNELASVILTALPSSWDPLIASVSLDATLTSASIIGRILQEDGRRKERTSTETALYAKSRSTFRAGVFCHGCGKEGHIRPECDDEDDQRNGNHKRSGQGSRGRSRGRGGRSSGRGRGKGRKDYAHVAKDNDDDEASEPEEYAFHAENTSTLATESTWLGDTGTSSHIVADRTLFINFTPVTGAIQGVGNCQSLGRGDVRVAFTTAQGTIPVTLKDALYAPTMRFNLISLGRLTSAGLSYEGNGKDLFIKDGGKLIGHGTKSGYLYRMAVKPISAISMIAGSDRSWYEWHCALGHVNKRQLKQLYRDGLVTGMNVDTSSDADFTCKACIQAKHTRASFPLETMRKISELGELIYSDVWGPSSTTSLSGHRYIITFTDGATRYVWTAFLKSRDEVPGKISDLDALIETQFGTRIKALRVDNAKEYTQGAAKSYTDKRGIRLEPTTPYSPEYNGVSERLNRTLVEHARAMLLAHDMPKYLWEEAVAYATHLKNISPTRALPGTTPYEALWQKKPDLSGIHEFGTDCWVRVNVPTSKLDAQSIKRKFVGIKPGVTGYRYYVPETRQVLTSREVIFPRQTELDAPIVETNPGLEGESLPNPPSPPTTPASKEVWATPKMSIKSSSSTPSTPMPPTPSTPVKSKTELVTPPAPRATRTARVDYLKLNDGPQKSLRSLTTRSKTRSSRASSVASSTASNAGPVSTSSVQGEISEISDPITEANFCFLADADSPQTLQDVMKREDWPQWKEAMDKEMNQLDKLGTYTVTDLPSGRKPVGCRWVFAIKHDANGNVIKYKARLVAQGFSQIPGQDFFATHAPVMRLETFRLIVSIAAHYDLELHQVDVIGAYLNSPLQEDIYMRQAPGYEDGTSRVYHLHKALYGLKQAGRAWRMELDRVLLESLGFTRSQSDPCLYHRSTDNDLSLIGTHVDDCLVASTDLASVNKLKSILRKYFDITDLGEATLFVGIQILRNRAEHTISICQTGYLDTVITRFGMDTCNPVSTPLDASSILTPSESDEDLLTDIPYQAVVGSLMYAAIGTRPDIAFAVQTLSQFNSAHTAAHWTAAKHVLRYLKGTRTLSITYGKTRDFVIKGYSDADWGQNRADRRSISGYAFLLGGGIVSWSSKKQSTVALSTMEAEYVALAHATKEALWFRSILGELGLGTNDATIIATDNLAAISFAQDHQFHGRSKHIDIRHYFVRERILDGTILVPHCSSEENVADNLTKALARIKHREQLALMNLSAR